MTRLRAEEFLMPAGPVNVPQGKLVSPHRDWKGDKDVKASRPRKRPPGTRKSRGGETGAAAAVREAALWFHAQSKYFTAGEVAARSGAPVRAASNCLAELRADGVLEIVHKLPSPAGGRPASVYRLKPGASL